MTVLTLMQTFSHFPATIERSTAAAGMLVELKQTWADRIGPVPDDFTVSVARPGEIGSSQMHRTHRGDEGEAMAQERGEVAVCFHMSDDEVPAGISDLVALTVRAGEIVDELLD